jgi:hypothetical protein
LRRRDVIRCPDPAQVRTAFRVHIPSSVRRAERNFDILAFEGSLWWPHVLNGSTFDEPLLTADECRAELASGKNDLLGLLGLLADSECDRMPERTIEQIAIRTTMYNGYDAILAIAQRKAYENLMFFEGQAYALGGEPVYTGWQFCELNVSSSGGRNISSLNALRNPPGDFKEEKVQDSYVGSWMLPADQHQAASRRFKRNGRPRPRIDVLLPETIRSDVVQIRTDAFFRRIVECITYPPFTFAGFWYSDTSKRILRDWSPYENERPWDPPNARKLLRLLENIISVSEMTISHDTTPDRLWAISELVEFLWKRGKVRPLSDWALRYCNQFRSFAEVAGLPCCRPKYLKRVDSEALAALGIS